MNVKKFYNNSPAEGCFLQVIIRGNEQYLSRSKIFWHVISLQYLCRFLVSDVPPTECEEEIRFEHGFGIYFL